MGSTVCRYHFCFRHSGRVLQSCFLGADFRFGQQFARFWNKREHPLVSENLTDLADFLNDDRSDILQHCNQHRSLSISKCHNARKLMSIVLFREDRREFSTIQISRCFWGSVFLSFWFRHSGRVLQSCFLGADVCNEQQIAWFYNKWPFWPVSEKMTDLADFPNDDRPDTLQRRNHCTPSSTRIRSLAQYHSWNFASPQTYLIPQWFWCTCEYRWLVVLLNPTLKSQCSYHRFPHIARSHSAPTLKSITTATRTTDMCR